MSNPYASMSGPKLEAKISTLRDRHSELWSEISRRDGKDYRMSDVRDLAKSGDKLAVKTVDAWNDVDRAQSELDYRKSYHGSNKPVKVRTWI